MQAAFSIEAMNIVTALAACAPTDLKRLWRLRAQAVKLVNPADAESEKPSLTPRELDALEAVRRLNGPHKPRPASTRAVAISLTVDDSWAYRLLASIRGKGYVQRIGTHRRGGWVVQ